MDGQFALGLLPLEYVLRQYLASMLMYEEGRNRCLAQPDFVAVFVDVYTSYVSGRKTAMDGKVSHFTGQALARLLDPEDVPSLWNGVFITGGEALKQEIIDKWGAKRAICNGYGPTEATIGVTMNPHIGSEAKPSNIGPPFDNVGAYVLTPGTDEPVLRGAVGELCVSGKLVGKGYLNRPDLTAKAFPFLERHGEKMYRTGDLVRLLADGSVSFIGRADTQTKLRGQRLEIDEIDAVIKGADAGISDVASIVADGELLRLTDRENKTHVINFRLRDLEARLKPGGFVRLSRGALVNLEMIARISPLPGGTYDVLLKNGQKLSSSRSQSKILRERLLKI